MGRDLPLNQRPKRLRKWLKRMIISCQDVRNGCWIDALPISLPSGTVASPVVTRNPGIIQADGKGQGASPRAPRTRAAPPSAPAHGADAAAIKVRVDRHGV